MIGYDEALTYRQIIKENIRYNISSVKLNLDISKFDEIIDLIQKQYVLKEQYAHCRQYLPI